VNPRSKSITLRKLSEEWNVQGVRVLYEIDIPIKFFHQFAGLSHHFRSFVAETVAVQRFAAETQAANAYRLLTDF
jgi:hypothetical protein